MFFEPSFFKAPLHLDMSPSSLVDLFGNLWHLMPEEYDVGLRAAFLMRFAIEVNGDPEILGLLGQVDTAGPDLCKDDELKKLVLQKVRGAFIAFCDRQIEVLRGN